MWQLYTCYRKLICLSTLSWRQIKYESQHCLLLPPCSGRHSGTTSLGGMFWDFEMAISSKRRPCCGLLICRCYNTYYKKLMIFLRPLKVPTVNHYICTKMFLQMGSTIIFPAIAITKDMAILGQHSQNGEGFCKVQEWAKFFQHNNHFEIKFNNNKSLKCDDNS